MQPVTASLNMHLLCPHHFISTCYERIEEYSPRFREQPFPEEIYTFLTECTPQIARLVENASDLDSLEQARLLHIVLTSYDLSRHLRRSPRRKASILVCLHGEKFGQMWKEKTATRVLSRYGALVIRQRAYEIYLARGAAPGDEVEDWLQAERELRLG
jgi:Protein of unknown function (DUF2934)